MKDSTGQPSQPKGSSMASYFHLDILPLVEDYLRLSGTAPSTFGGLALNAHGFVSRLRKGCQPRLDTIERVLEYIHGRVDELLADSVRRCAEMNLRAEYNAITEEADDYGIDLINQTMLLPISITALGQAVERRA